MSNFRLNEVFSFLSTLLIVKTFFCFLIGLIKKHGIVEDTEMMRGVHR